VFPVTELEQLTLERITHERTAPSTPKEVIAA